VGDFVNPRSLAASIRRHADAVSLYLMGRLSATTLQVLASDQGTDYTLRAQKALVEDLNRIIGGQAIFESNRFAAIELRPETRRLLDQHPEGDALLRLNRLLLEDAYPLEIARKHIVFQMLDPRGALIAGISFQSNEAEMVDLKFISRTKEKREFKVEATQMTDSGRIVGGMTCLVKTGPK
jgi:hypothetical protein